MRPRSAPARRPAGSARPVSAPGTRRAPAAGAALRAALQQQTLQRNGPAHVLQPGATVEVKHGVHHELELAVIIGSRACKVRDEASAMGCVADACASGACMLQVGQQSSKLSTVGQVEKEDNHLFYEFSFICLCVET